MTPRVVMPARRRRVLLSGYRGVIALRWVGVVLLIAAALTTPGSQWPAGSVAVAIIASRYNLGAMIQQRRGDVPRRVRWALLCADFVGCMVAMLSMLSIKSVGSGPMESIGLLVIGVEAVVLFDLAGYAWLCVATPPALALAAWDQARVMHSSGDAAQWVFTWATFLLLLGLLALRGKQDNRLRGELKRLAATDDLTGLANRRSFRSTLASELGRSVRTERQLCLLLMDLDHFKMINDTLGHGAGDRVLANVGELLESGLLRSGIDVAARVGGEEFAIILPETDEAGGVRVAERVRLAVASQVDNIGTTVSIGVAASHPGDSTDSLLRAADTALYGAKDDGRNCVRVAGYSSQHEIGAA
jgi:diguanylate cyclase (GGDEF)-like protein